MKISCETCGTKYSIADEKVADRTFKVRCKRCSSVIVVRAAATAPPAVREPEPAPAPVDVDAIWHVVIDQQQVGPLTIEQLADEVAAGRASADSYLWREGMDDWQPIAEVGEVAAVLGVATAPVD